MMILEVTTPEQLAILTEDEIVVCGYTLTNGDYVEGIDIVHSEAYPELQAIEVVVTDTSL